MNDKYLKELIQSRQDANKSADKKVPVYIKLDPSVVSYFKSQGRGYQTRINDILTEYVALAQSDRLGQAIAGGVSTSAPSEEERALIGQQLFKRYYAQCFWHLRPDLEVTVKLLPLIAQGLRRHGGREGFMEAKKLCP
jgi:hypothetical protein